MTVSEWLRAIDASHAAPQALLMWLLLVLALLASRSIGMSFGALAMVFGALTHNALFVTLGALWAYAMTPDKPEGGSDGGQQRHA